MGDEKERNGMGDEIQGVIIMYTNMNKRLTRNDGFQLEYEVCNLRWIVNFPFHRWVLVFRQQSQDGGDMGLHHISCTLKGRLADYALLTCNWYSERQRP